MSPRDKRTHVINYSLNLIPEILISPNVLSNANVIIQFFSRKCYTQIYISSFICIVFFVLYTKHLFFSFPLYSLAVLKKKQMWYESEVVYQLFESAAA